MAMCASCADPDVSLPAGNFEVSTPTGERLEVVRGFVEVPENRNAADGRMIRVAYFKISAVDAKRKGHPTYMLPGGPGGSYVERLLEGSTRTDQLHEYLQIYRAVADVILVDLRGIMGSTPHTKCPSSVRQWRGIKDSADLNLVTKTAGERCRNHLNAAGFDTSGYNVLEAASDVIAVADHLGHQRIRLHGVSFGSHWAMVTARQYPERIDEMVLSGIEGFDHTFDDPIGVRKALERISQNASKVWNGRHGVEHPLLALDGRTKSLRRDTQPSDTYPSRLDMQSFVIGGADYHLSSRNGMVDWPKAMDRLMQGKGFLQRVAKENFGGLLAHQPGGDAAAVGMFDCASWSSEGRLERLQKVQRSSDVFLPDTTSEYVSLCEGWAVKPLGKAFYSTASVDVPALFIQGDLDTSTPFENAEQMADVFVNAHLVKISNGSHRAYAEAINEAPGFRSDLLEWLRSGKLPAQVYDLPPVEFRPL